MNKQRFLLVVSGPSGCGKDTVVQRVIEKGEKIEIAISATTRLPRAGEAHGEHYHFITKEQFEQNINQNNLLEYAEYVGNYYGTLRSEVDDRIANGITCVLVIEVQGAAAVKRIYPECTTIFVTPPSMEELEHRLRGRGSETDDWIQKRLHRAKEELEFAPTYDYCIVNDTVEDCADTILKILEERQSR